MEVNGSKGAEVLDSYIRALEAKGIEGGYDLDDGNLPESRSYKRILEEIWPDAPKHYCSKSVDLERHNDPRALTWCCDLSKRCAKLYRKLEDFGISPELYEKTKTAWAEELEARRDPRVGLVVCFDSIAYCCKRKECGLRDPALDVLEISLEEYYSLKRELGDAFLNLFEQSKMERDAEST